MRTVFAQRLSRLGAETVFAVSDDARAWATQYGLYANAYRGKVRKANRVPVLLGMIEEEPRPVPSKGWAEMIRKVYEVDALICPRCGRLAVLMEAMRTARRPRKAGTMIADDAKEGGELSRLGRFLGRPDQSSARRNSGPWILSS